MNERDPRLFIGSAFLNLLRLGDGVVATCAMASALLIWSVVAPGPFTWAHMTEHAAWFLLVAPWMLLIRQARRPDVMWSLWETAVTAAHAAVVIVVLYALIFFLAPRELLPRLVVMYFAVLAFLTTLVWRFVFVRAAPRTMPPNRVVIIGVGSAAHVIADVLRAKTPHTQVLAFIGDRGPAQDTAQPPVRHVDSLERFVAEQDVSALILAHDRPFTPALSRAVVSVKKRHVDVIAMQTVYEQLLRRVPIRHLIPDTVVVRSDDMGGDLSSLAQRVFDIAAGVVGCAVVLLLLPVLAPAIWLDVGWPIFFWQERVGLTGHPFRLVKFRTMGRDAESDGPQWAGERDPRTSGFGRLLRRFHLDELPQFWNMLKGEMSLVGPRPERPEFTDRLERAIPYYAERCAVRPGLIGWAQINYPYGRSIEDAITKLEYDLYYIKHRSLSFDLLITLHTAWTILSRGNRTTRSPL